MRRSLPVLPVFVLCFALTSCPGTTTVPDGDGGPDGSTVDAMGLDAPVTADDAGGDAPSATCGTDADGDGDGVDSIACGGTDCDDGDPLRTPGRAEVCDGADLDEDCDPTTFGTRDLDLDGDPDATCCNDDGAGGENCGTDCDDSRAAVSSTGTETCNGLDDDCDDATDETLSTVAYYPDCDGDDFGDVSATPESACAVPTVAVPCAAGGAWVANGTDCNDAAAAANPGAPETCNGTDDDCNSAVDEGLPTMSYRPDCDGDGYGDTSATPMVACSVPAAGPGCAGGVWVTMAGDCSDTVASIHTGAMEVCNDADDDCDGLLDELLPVSAWRPDCDRDSWGATSATPVMACAAPSTPPPSCPSGAWVSNTGDCADSAATRNPGVVEVCNAIDDDCDSLVDDIADGVVVCTAGSSRACTNACGVSGTQTCDVSCTGFVACSSTATEVCNYCDDDGDGTLADDAALAMTTRTTAYFPRCESTFGESVCEPRGPATPPFFFDAVVLRGLANDRAGAVWLDPSTWVSGYGPVLIDVRMTVTGHPENGSALVEGPHGGWAIVVATSGTPGVGTPRAFGIPTGLTGLAARWHWNTRVTSPGNTFSGDDSLSLLRLPSALRRPSGSSAVYWNGSTGTSDVVAGPNAADFGGATTAVAQRMRLRYTPDHPMTTAINEERVELIVGDGSATVLYAASDGYAQSPNRDIPPGSPIRIGITAGTYVETGQFYIPPGEGYGVPVEARVQLWRLTYNPVDGERYDSPEATMSLGSVCAP